MARAAYNKPFRGNRNVSPPSFYNYRASGAPGSFQGINPLLYLPMNDLGAGAVNTVPAFATGSAVATFARASVNNYCKLASGLWAPVATGIARAHYLGRDTAVGAYGGYLSEPAGVQLVTPTAAIRDMTDASWIKVGMTAAKTATGIDGVPNSCTTITATAPNATILQTLVAAASSRTYAPFVRRNVGSGTVLLRQGTATLDITASLSSVIFTRPQLNDNELNVAYGIQINTTNDALDVDFNQFEALISTQFASSPMASAGAARAADVLTYAGPGNFDPTQLTAYAEVATNFTNNGGSAYIVGFPADARFMFGNVSTANSVGDGTLIASKGGLSDANGVVRKRVISAGVAGIFVTGDGLAPATAAFDGSMGTGANIHVGHNAGFQQLNGTEKELRLFPTQVSSAALSALTA